MLTGPIGAAAANPMKNAAASTWMSERNTMLRQRGRISLTFYSAFWQSRIYTRLPPTEPFEGIFSRWLVPALRWVLKSRFGAD